MTHYQLWQGYAVFALDRIIGRELKELPCQRFECDLASSGSIDRFASHFRSFDEPLDLLLNIAGVMAPKADDALESVAPSTLLSTFQVNTFGPLLLSRALLPSLL